MTSEAVEATRFLALKFKCVLCNDSRHVVNARPAQLGTLDQPWSQCSIMARSWLMEEEERQSCLHPIIEDGGGNSHGGHAASRAASEAGGSSGGGCIKRTVRIAEQDPQSPTHQAKQASIRIYEARCKTKIKVCKVHWTLLGWPGILPSVFTLDTWPH